MKLRRLISTAATAVVVLGVTLFGPATASAQEAAAHSYVALGDSYSSGVGTNNYYGDSGNCKRSPDAYPVRWANANAPSRFDFVACSGARTSDVINNQLWALNSGTTLVSISIGGNDAGFASVMQDCVVWGESTCLRRVAEANAFIDSQLPGRLHNTYSAIRAKAPNARVVVLGYPRMYQLNGSCWGGLSERSRAAINGASDNLHEETSKVAANWGFNYGDTRPIFTGHEICSNDWWLNSTNWGNIGESYHPNVNGQRYGYYPVFASRA